MCIECIYNFVFFKGRKLKKNIQIADCIADEGITPTCIVTKLGGIKEKKTTQQMTESKNKGERPDRKRKSKGPW